MFEGRFVVEKNEAWERAVHGNVNKVR